MVILTFLLFSQILASFSPNVPVPQSFAQSKLLNFVETADEFNGRFTGEFSEKHMDPNIVYMNKFGQLVEEAQQAICPSGCCGPPPPLKCCDSACPKCLGLSAPISGACQHACPGGCPNECPCDACVCCFTDTVLVTETSTCINVLFSTLISTATQTAISILQTTITTDSTIIFSLTTNFLFTSISIDTITFPSTITSTSTFFKSSIQETTFYFFTRTSFVTALIVETSTKGTLVTGTTTTVFTSFLPTALTESFVTSTVDVTTTITTTPLGVKTIKPTIFFLPQ